MQGLPHDAGSGFRGPFVRRCLGNFASGVSQGDAISIEAHIAASIYS